MNLLRSIATLGFVGYLPMSGTIASLCMTPILLAGYFLQFSVITQALVIIVVTVVSWCIIHQAIHYFPEDKDPSVIVLDECVGMLVTFYMVPWSWFGLVLGFLIFRLLDISKIFGISKIERLPGAWGILLDDVVAALMTNIILRFLVPLVCV